MRPQIPALPATLATPCNQPAVTAGQPILAEFAKDRQALATCARKHADTVTFYGGVRSRFGGRR